MFVIHDFRKITSAFASFSSMGYLKLIFVIHNGIFGFIEGEIC